jgi:hypothetical protein
MEIAKSNISELPDICCNKNIYFTNKNNSIWEILFEKDGDLQNLEHF